MSKTDKRAKRARDKAKQARLKKQRSQEQSNLEDVVKISQKIKDMFETLPGFSPDYEAVPHLKKYVMETSEIHRDMEMSVAILFVMYGHWKTEESDSVYYSDLLMVAQEIVEQQKFLEQFHTGNT